MPERAHPQSKARVSLTVDGRNCPFVFATREGGQTDSEGAKTNPGGGLDQVASAGRRTVENLTMTGQFVPSRDHAFVRWLRTRCGVGECVASEQLLDADGNAFGRPDTWTGLLKLLNTGNYDANSDDPRMITVEVLTDGVA